MSVLRPGTGLRITKTKERKKIVLLTILNEGKFLRVMTFIVTKVK